MQRHWLSLVSVVGAVSLFLGILETYCVLYPTKY